MPGHRQPCRPARDRPGPEAATRSPGAAAAAARPRRATGALLLLQAGGNAGVGRALHRERSHLQPRRPSLTAFLNEIQVVAAE